MTIKNLYPTIKPSLDLNFAQSKTLDPKVTFSRASTASYYDGKTVAKAEENLLTYSQDFDTATWAKALGTPVTVVANVVTAPDGTNTADLLIPGQSNGYQYIAQTKVVGVQYTVSVYAKTAGYNYVALSNSADTTRTATFDLVNGTITFVGSNASATISAAQNGFYRCTITFNTAWSNIGIHAHNSSGVISTFTGDGTSGVYIWGAQLEQRSSTTAYTPTTSAPITNYLPALQYAAAGVPRFDHDPITGESKGLLIEESRTNLLTYSDQFDSSGWVKTRCSIATNQVAAPDGTLTADKLIEDTSNSTHAIQSSAIALSATSYTATIYAKAAERSWMLLRGGVSSINATMYINLSTGVAGSVNNGVSAYSITPVGNGWFKCSITFTSTAVTDYGVSVFTASGNNIVSYQGDGYSGIYLWGAQLEAGAFPTSYIPTTTAQVTRAADSASMTGANFSSWYRQDEGTLLADYEATGLSSSAQFYAVSANVGLGISSIFAINAQSYANQHRGLVLSPSGAIDANIAQQSATRAKVAFAAKVNDFALSLNGASASVDTLGGMPACDRLTLGAAYSTSVGGAGCLKRITYYPKRLTDAQLQALTQ